MLDKCEIDIGSVGEFTMFGITMPGLDVTSTDEHARVIIPCTKASMLAIRIMDLWNVSNQEKANILGVSSRTVKRYSNGVIPKHQEQRDRIRDIVIIYKSLRVLFPVNKHQRNHWVSAANDQFDGKSALEHMIDMGTQPVRQYLESQLFN